MKSNSGFTLIEVLIYMGLFVLVIGGLLLTTYAVIESSGHLQDKTVVNEEADFIIRKIDWALTNATAISCPVAGQLQITKLGLLAGQNPLLFTFSSNNLTLKRGSASAIQLNSTDVKITSLVFTCVQSLNGKPASADTQLTLSSISASQSFDNKKYLRQ